MTAGSDARSALVLAWGTVRHAAFPDRVAAAAAASYDAIGLSVAEYDRLVAQGWDDGALGRVLDDHSITLDEIEVLIGFFADPGPAGVASRPGLQYADPHVEQTARHLGEVFGARRLQVVGTFDDRPVDDRVVTRFGELCDRMAPAGMQVALEFVPYTNIPDVSAARAIVDAADRDNGGLCIDTWHVFRGGVDWDALAGLDAHHVVMVQLNDGPATPHGDDLATEAVHGRRTPGDGGFPLERFFDVLAPALDGTPISVEVYSDEHDRLASADVATRTAQASRPLLARLDRGRGAVGDRDHGEEVGRNGSK